MSDILDLLKRYRLRLLAGAVAVLLTNSILIFGPRLLGMAIDDLKDGLMERPLGWYIGWMLAISFGQGLTRFAMRRIIIGTSRRVERDLRGNFLSRLLELPRRFYATRYTGDIMSRATQDIENVRMAAGPALMYTLDTVLLFAYGIVMMFWISPGLTLLVLILLPIISGLVFWLSRKIHEVTMESQRQFGRVSTRVQEAMSGIRVIQAYTCQDQQQAQFEQELLEYRRIQMRMIRIQAAFRPMLGLLFSLGQGLILLAGGRAIMIGSLSLGDYVAFSAYLTMLSWPMVAIGWSLNLLQRGSAGMRRLNDILLEGNELPSGTLTSEIKGGLSFSKLGYSYPDSSEPALADLSFELAPGRTLGVVGPTGCGKSTLLRLAARQMDPDSGTIQLDGLDLASYDLDHLRRHVTAVPQEAFLFSDTLRQNVRFGRPEAGQDSLDEAAQNSRLQQDLVQFTERWNTRVGERGVTLSGGQKQRATIARALLMEARVLLMDDALSAIDTQTEEALIQRLKEVMRGRTTLIASHRLSIMREVDEIIVLDRGRIVERGTHDELRAAGGLYADLLRRQEIESELAGGVA